MLVLTDSELLEMIKHAVYNEKAGADIVFFGTIYGELKFRLGDYNSDLLDYQIKDLDKRGIIKASYQNEILNGVFIQSLYN